MIAIVIGDALEHNLDLYRSSGLVLLVFGIFSALYIYLILGIAPLVALFIGIAVIGASMFLTPPASARGSRDLVVMLSNMLVNVASFLEALRVGSSNVFVRHGDHVYVYISTRPLKEIPRNPPSTSIAYDGDNIIVALRSPVTRDLVSGSSDICESIDLVVVELMDLADRVTCIDSDGELIVRFTGHPVSEPGRVVRALGGLHGLLAGSIVSLYRGAVSVSSEDLSDGVRVIRVVQVD